MKVFIAGGTSGIGLELAIKYSKRGDEVAVCGRDIHRVDKIYHSLFLLYEVDICNKSQLQTVVNEFSQGKLDLLIISAGSYADDSLNKISYQQSINMLKINIAGVVNAFEVGRIAMFKSQSPRIALLASVSGLLYYKQATTYSKSKRAAIQIAEAYRRGLQDFGIKITVVAPGYIDTLRLRELNHNDLSKKPFVISTTEATSIIMDGLDKGSELIIFPQKMRYLMMFISILPSFIQSLIMHRKARWMNRK